MESFEGDIRDTSSHQHSLYHIVSGGQTGADQGALDAAIFCGLPFSGWVPLNRWTEHGALSPKYTSMKETPSADPAQRTEWNVRDSDATLIIVHGPLYGGSLLTHAVATMKYQRPCLVVDLDSMSKQEAIVKTRDWLKQNKVRTLNVAGPRQSEDSRIYKAVKNLLVALIIKRE